MVSVRQRPPMSARALSPNLPQRLLDNRHFGELAATHPYEGIVTTDGRLEGLFPLKATGAPTEALLTAAHDLLGTLDPTAASAATFAVDSPEWRKWSNVHPFMLRHGALIEDLDPVQRERALALVTSALSESGSRVMCDVMHLNETLRELTGSDEEYGEWLYWLSLMGTPSTSEPWGFQLDGHHMNLNCLCLGDQLVLSPWFLGSEPTCAEAGKYAGTRVFAEEEAAALQLAQSLSAEQRGRAVVSEATPLEVFGVAFKDNLTLDYEGLAFGELTPSQQERLVELISIYLGRIRPEHAAVKLGEVREHLEATYFSWRGGLEDDSAFYFRIHSPVVLIEFDHLAGIAFDNDTPTRDHIHTVVRTPNGNDYGQDLLRQHYAEAHAPR
jgi:hypothetical protein